MNKYKICVYAISKNEEKFINRWVDSIKDADEIYVLDTGSTDNTVELLKKKGVNVISKKITPWRFDVARNESLSLVPSDTNICICLDLDEVISEGWRKALEENWDENTDRIFYNYNWLLDENNIPKVSFYIEKIHRRKGYYWTHPVHEVLSYDGEESFITLDNMTLNHYPDEKIHKRHGYKWTHPVHEILSLTENKEENKKVVEQITVNHYPDNTKSRSSYLPLLEFSVKEDPDDDRNMHYLGREYMYYGKYQEAITTLKKHLNMEKAVWKDERCASMRFIARSYRYLEKYKEAIYWYEKAIIEAPYLRDPYVELALLYYELKDWEKVIFYSDKALEIKESAKSYINEQFSWDHTIYDLKSISYYYLNNKEKALENINIALTYASEDERLLNNKKVFENM